MIHQVAAVRAVLALLRSRRANALAAWSTCSGVPVRPSRSFENARVNSPTTAGVSRAGSMVTKIGWTCAASVGLGLLELARSPASSAGRRAGRRRGNRRSRSRASRYLPSKSLQRTVLPALSTSSNGPPIAAPASGGSPAGGALRPHPPSKASGKAGGEETGTAWTWRPGSCSANARAARAESAQAAPVRSFVEEEFG